MRTLLIVSALALAACDPEQKRCDRWLALDEAYRMCADDPGCEMRPHHYESWARARRAAAWRCLAAPPMPPEVRR